MELHGVSALLQNYGLFCVLNRHNIHAGVIRKVEGENKTNISLNSDPFCPCSDKFGLEASIQNSTAAYYTQKKQILKPRKLIVCKVKHAVIFHPLTAAEDLAHLIKRSGEAGSGNQKSKGKFNFFITE